MKEDGICWKHVECSLPCVRVEEPRATWCFYGEEWSEEQMEGVGLRERNNSPLLNFIIFLAVPLSATHGTQRTPKAFRG